MATYYVRKTGSDGGAGTSPSTAWATIGKALGAAGIASGDKVYIGGGVYRETVTVAMTSAIAETKVIGDTDGGFTGDPGEVQWTAYTTNDSTAPAASRCLDLAGRDFLTFENINFQGGNGNVIITTANSSTNITFTRCQFVAGMQAATAPISLTVAANVALNWFFDSCIFVKGSGSGIVITPVRPATADFDLNFILFDCAFYGGAGACIQMNTPTGTNTFNTGGVLAYNCLQLSGGNFMVVSSANWSTTIPCKAYNNRVYSSTTGLVAATSGQIVEDYNVLLCGATPRTNVTAGTHSVSDGSISPLFYTGHEYLASKTNLKPFGMPKPSSPELAFGNQAGGPSTDILGNTRPATHSVGPYEFSTPYVYFRHILEHKRLKRRFEMMNTSKKTIL